MKASAGAVAQDTAYGIFGCVFLFFFAHRRNNSCSCRLLGYILELATTALDFYKTCVCFLVISRSSDRTAEWHAMRYRRFITDGVPEMDVMVN